MVTQPPLKVNSGPNGESIKAWAPDRNIRGRQLGVIPETRPVIPECPCRESNEDKMQKIKRAKLRLHKTTLAGIPIGPGFPVRIMGVVNVSPESFYKGSVYQKGDRLAQMVRKMTQDGADMIDVGAMSTAPYLKTQISGTEEIKRLTWAIKIIKKNSHLPISIDTAQSRTAEAGLARGAQILNDITGLFGDPRMGQTARKAKGIILMAHPRAVTRYQSSPPKTIQAIFSSILKKAQQNHIPPAHICLDPGIGFFRGSPWPWWKWDLEVLKYLKHMSKMRFPLLVGLSRKSFIGEALGGLPPEGRLWGSLGANVWAAINGAKIIRTHDVKETREAIRMVEAIEV